MAVALGVTSAAHSSTAMENIMAKTQEAIARATGIMARNPGNLAETTPDLSSKVSKAIDAIKKPFTSFVKDFAALSTTREELAPKFMKAFGLFQAETGGTFVMFVRYLDPSIGAARNEYRSHRTYQAADYLRRIVGNARNRPQSVAERQAAPAPPTDVLARILASLVSILPEGQKEKVYDALKQEARWTDRQVERMHNQVEHVDPLVEIKGRTLENLRLTIPEQSSEEKAA
jgi:hypothetical protein